MQQMLFAGILAFLIILFSISKIIFVFKKKNLFDNPDAVRKLHTKPTSSVGGVGLFLGFMVLVLFTGNLFGSTEFSYYTASFLPIFFIGIKDSIVEISAFKKFAKRIVKGNTNIHLHTENENYASPGSI